jgi:hypothetical protein
MTDAERIVENERALQRPTIRADRTAVRALLDSGFLEVDHTGKVWDVDGVVEALAGQKRYTQPKLTDIRTTWLASTARLLTYSDGAVYHSSVWLLAPSGEWRMRFHQQTLIAA